MIIVFINEFSIHDFFESIMELLVSMLWDTVVEVHVDGEAHQGSDDGFGEDSKGDVADEPVEEKDEDCWSNEVLAIWVV